MSILSVVFYFEAENPDKEEEMSNCSPGWQQSTLCTHLSENSHTTQPAAVPYLILATNCLLNKRAV